MGQKREIYTDSSIVANGTTKVPVVLGAINAEDDRFQISTLSLNNVEISETATGPFPGNIAPEGYFYSPFYEVTLKELEDEVQSITVRRVNFDPKTASVVSKEVECYNPEMGITSLKTLYLITLKSPIPYNNIINGQPFCIYDIANDMTYRGFLESMSGLDITIASEQEIDETGLRGEIEETSGKSTYIISLMEENAPIYAEFLPSSQKLVWRGLKKMSELSSDSPLYNMPFTNGRNYIHRNINVFVRRQDPNNDYKLFRPSVENPLRRFQVEGDAKLDFDQIQTIIDSMVNAC